MTNQIRTAGQLRAARYRLQWQGVLGDGPVTAKHPEQEGVYEVTEYANGGAGWLLKKKATDPSGISGGRFRSLESAIKDAEDHAFGTGRWRHKTATTAERVLSRFEEGKPADPTENMSPEDAKKWREQTDEHKDEFKSAADKTATKVEIKLQYDSPTSVGKIVSPSGRAEYYYTLGNGAKMSYSDREKFRYQLRNQANVREAEKLVKELDQKVPSKTAAAKKPSRPSVEETPEEKRFTQEREKVEKALEDLREEIADRFPIPEDRRHPPEAREVLNHYLLADRLQHKAFMQSVGGNSDEPSVLREMFGLLAKSEAEIKKAKRLLAEAAAMEKRKSASSVSVLTRFLTADQDKAAPEQVDKYFKQVKKDNPSYSDSQAYATAWSIYCKHKNPGSESCHQDEYLTGKTAAWKAPAINQALAKLIAKKVDRHFVTDLLNEKLSGRSWEAKLKEAIGKAVAPTQMRDQVEAQPAIKKWLADLSDSELSKIRDLLEETLNHGKSEQYKAKPDAWKTASSPQELHEMRKMLERSGYDPDDAQVLQEEGMGPDELAERLRVRPGAPGSLGYSHRLKLMLEKKALQAIAWMERNGYREDPLLRELQQQLRRGTPSALAGAQEILESAIEAYDIPIKLASDVTAARKPKSIAEKKDLQLLIDQLKRNPKDGDAERALRGDWEYRDADIAKVKAQTKTAGAGEDMIPQIIQDLSRIHGLGAVEVNDFSRPGASTVDFSVFADLKVTASGSVQTRRNGPYEKKPLEFQADLRSVKNTILSLLKKHRAYDVMVVMPLRKNSAQDRLSEPGPKFYDDSIVRISFSLALQAKTAGHSYAVDSMSVLFVEGRRMTPFNRDTIDDINHTSIEVVADDGELHEANLKFLGYQSSGILTRIDEQNGLRRETRVDVQYPVDEGGSSQTSARTALSALVRLGKKLDFLVEPVARGYQPQHRQTSFVAKPKGPKSPFGRFR